ncbi:MAG: hypothetical protein BWK77_01325 [Verrucomicrobia bacterium A1]|nr:MAG: hypothetical protein BWK77_01325 [Verrucomicrobia bacterium A1]
MNALCFVDTNVLVYGRDASEVGKQPVARLWMQRLWEERAGRTGIQVLNEYFVTVTTRLKPGLPAVDAWRDVTRLFAWNPTPLDRHVLARAREIQVRFRLSWWDSLIVAAAGVSGCSHLLTEDLQDGQNLEGVLVVNPFRHNPDELS